MAFSTLCSPGRRRSRRVKRSSRVAAAAALDGPGPRPAGSRRWRIRRGDAVVEKKRLRAAVGLAATSGSSAFSTAMSLATLVEEDPLLGGQVAGEVAVPVEMVGRDVEQRRRARAKAIDRLELEARQLDDEDPVRRSVDHRRERPPDVAADLDGEAGAGEQRAGHRRGGRLAVAAGDADHRGSAVERETTRRARPPRRSAGPALAAATQQRMVEPHARDSPRGVETRREARRTHRTRRSSTPGSRPGRRRRAPRRRGGRSPPPRCRGCAAGAPRPSRTGRGRGRRRARGGRDRRSRVARHRSFRVESAIRANITETIQKRTMIFGSAQPAELEVVVDAAPCGRSACRAA